MAKKFAFLVFIPIICLEFSCPAAVYYLNADDEVHFQISAGYLSSVPQEFLREVPEEEQTLAPGDQDDSSPYVVIIDCHPYPGQGIEEGSLRVPDDTPVVIRIQDDTGIAEESVEMEINGFPVSPSLLRPVLSGDPTDYWLVYHNPAGSWTSDEVVEVSVKAADLNGNQMEEPFIYSFRVESAEEREWATGPAAVPAITYFDSDSGKLVIIPDPGDYFSYWIEGARIIYDPEEPVEPRFGPLDEIPELDLACGASYLPLALEPYTVFVQPVTVYIPCPYGLNPGELEIYYYNPGIGWEEADSIEEWMVPGSRVNHGPDDPEPTDPPTIEIQVNYFAAVQAGGDEENIRRCFVATAAFGSPLAREVKVLCLFRDRYLRTNPLGKLVVRGYDKFGPRAAELIRSRPVLKKIIRAALTPVVRVSKFLISR